MTPNGFIPAYYPPSWLGGWLSPYDTYDVFVLLHLVLGALGVYAFSRVVGARPLSSWLAGLLAFTAAFWIHWSLHLGHLVGLVGVPWALVATHLVVTRPRARHVAFLGAVFGLWWLGGNPQYVYYGTLAMGAYGGTLLVARAAAGRAALVPPALSFVAALALGAALAAPVLLSTASITKTILRTREPPSSTADTHLHGADAIRLLVNEARGNPPDHVKGVSRPRIDHGYAVRRRHICRAGRGRRARVASPAPAPRGGDGGRADAGLHQPPPSRAVPPAGLQLLPRQRPVAGPVAGVLVAARRPRPRRPPRRRAPGQSGPRSDGGRLPHRRRGLVLAPAPGGRGTPHLLRPPGRVHGRGRGGRRGRRPPRPASPSPGHRAARRMHGRRDPLPHPALVSAHRRAHRLPGGPRRHPGQGTGRAPVARQRAPAVAAHAPDARRANGA